VLPECRNSPGGGPVDVEIELGLTRRLKYLLRAVATGLYRFPYESCFDVAWTTNVRAIRDQEPSRPSEPRGITSFEQ
jgi:hypothetical protein